MGTIASIERKLNKLTTLVQQMVVRQVKACGIFSIIGHPTDTCPTLQDGNIEQVNPL